MIANMASHPLRQICLLTFLCASLPTYVYGLSQTYCSNQNTGSNDGPNYWKYQSNGWCHDKCVDSYAFAVVQGSNCWCSNYAPQNQVSVDKCSDVCPGFGEESCGNVDDGLYGYIQLNIKASGTAGGSSASSTKGPPASSSSSPSPSPSATPSSVSSSAQPPSSSKTSAESSSQAASPSTSAQASSTPASSTQSSSSTWSPTPITSIQIITESGAAITKTVTIIPTSPSGQLEPTQREGVSGGAIAGAVVGSLAGLALIVGLIVWFLAYRRRRQREGDYETGGIGPAERASPQRHASTLSKAGLLRSEKQYPPVAIPGPIRKGSNGTEGISPTSGSHGSSSERRHSKPLFYDQRLNPSALMDLDNGSRTSIATIEDNRDYTRTLNVRNPDPPEE